MISYEAGDYHFSFVWSFRGSLIPRGILFCLPSAGMAVGWCYLLEMYPSYFDFLRDANLTGVWTVSILCLGMLMALRINLAYARFWEGATLLKMMRAEWFEAASILTAFSKHASSCEPFNMLLQGEVIGFQALLVRLMSVMHGAALRKIGGDTEEFEVIDLHGLDNESLEYLANSDTREVNDVEILLHWIQVLITDEISARVMTIPPPLLTRAFQTLSRGMVNFHDARKITEVPFPFPLAQMHVILLWIQCLLAPLVFAMLIPNPIAAAIVSAFPMCGIWCLLFIASQLEQPFGNDSNDLPLSTMQFEMNVSLLMLLDPEAVRAPTLKKSAARNVWQLRAALGDPDSTTEKSKMLLRGKSLIDYENDEGDDDHFRNQNPKRRSLPGRRVSVASMAAASVENSQDLGTQNKASSAMLKRRKQHMRKAAAAEALEHGIGMATDEDGGMILTPRRQVSSASSVPSFADMDYLNAFAAEIQRQVTPSVGHQNASTPRSSASQNLNASERLNVFAKQATPCMSEPLSSSRQVSIAPEPFAVLWSANNQDSKWSQMRTSKESASPRSSKEVEAVIGKGPGAVWSSSEVDSDAHSSSSPREEIQEPEDWQPPTMMVCPTFLLHPIEELDEQPPESPDSRKPPDFDWQPAEQPQADSDDQPPVSKNPPSFLKM